jgi:hypothetical protein
MSIVTQIPDLLAHSAQSYALQRLTDPGIHWWYLPVTAGYDDAETLTEYRGSFSHTIFGPDVGPISPLWETCFNILLTALDRQGQKLGTVFRVRYGFCTRTPYPVVHSPHVDQGQEHRTALYYVMPTDGDTVVYNEQAVYGDPEVPATYTEAARITPVQNLWADFDGAHFHSSTSPVAHEERLVLTFNYSIISE